MAIASETVASETVASETSRSEDSTQSSPRFDSELSESVVTTTAELIDEHETGADRAPLPKLFKRTAVFVLFSSLLLMPLAFGGVHPSAYLLERITICAVLLIMWAQAKGRVLATFQSGSASSLICSGILLFCAVALFNALVLSLQSISHPVLGTVGSLASWDAVREGLFSMLTFCALFAVIRGWMGSQQHLADSLHRLLLFIGLVISLTALSHWFYDNGKLFWTFEPQTVFTSTRARWPFVNSNHLGHFLLPVIFIALGTLRALSHDLRSVALSTQKANKRSWKLLLQSTRVQNRIIRIALLSAVVITATIAIIASLSRGAWLGTGVGIFVFLVLRHLSFAQTSSAKSPWQFFKSAASFGGNDHGAESNGAHAERTGPAHSGMSRRRKKNPGRVSMPLSADSISQTFARTSRFAIPLFFLFGLALTYFFLFGRGSELFLDRLQYGLLYSHSDLRWQLYQDTLGMLQGHWFLGVGLGCWSFFYSSYADLGMSGMTPVYLHSDPYQVLVETGVFGAAILGSLVVIISKQVVTCVYGSEGHGVSVLIGAFCGLVALMVASLVDFPFHIPAIASLAAACLALIAFYLDKQELNTAS